MASYSALLGLLLLLAVAAAAQIGLDDFDDEYRFGKRSAGGYRPATMQDKRNGAPQPFVRFGRSGGQLDHMHDLLSTIGRLQYANN